MNPNIPRLRVSAVNRASFFCPQMSKLRNPLNVSRKPSRLCAKQLSSELVDAGAYESGPVGAGAPAGNPHRAVVLILLMLAAEATAIAVAWYSATAF